MDTFSYNQGWQDGRNQGWVQGCDEGRLQGHHSGYRVGYNDGQQDGYRQGWDEGVDACNVEMRKQLEYTRGYVAEIEALKLEVRRLNDLLSKASYGCPDDEGFAVPSFLQEVTVSKTEGKQSRPYVWNDGVPKAEGRFGIQDLFQKGFRRAVGQIAAGRCGQIRCEVW